MTNMGFRACLRIEREREIIADCQVAIIGLKYPQVRLVCCLLCHRKKQIQRKTSTKWPIVGLNWSKLHLRLCSQGLSIENYFAGIKYILVKCFEANVLTYIGGDMRKKCMFSPMESDYYYLVHSQKYQLQYTLGIHPP